MRNVFVCIVAFVAASVSVMAQDSTAPASPAPAPKAAAPDDDSAMFGFTPGKTTVAEVKEKFGKPTLENHGFPDAYSVVFNPSPDVMIACLFDKNDVLIRVRAYTKK